MSTSTPELERFMKLVKELEAEVVRYKFLATESQMALKELFYAISPLEVSKAEVSAAYQRAGVVLAQSARRKEQV